MKKNKVCLTLLVGFLALGAHAQTRGNPVNPPVKPSDAVRLVDLLSASNALYKSVSKGNVVADLADTALSPSVWVEDLTQAMSHAAQNGVGYCVHNASVSHVGGKLRFTARNIGTLTFRMIVDVRKLRGQRLKWHVIGNSNRALRWSYEIGGDVVNHSPDTKNGWDYSRIVPVTISKPVDYVVLKASCWMESAGLYSSIEQMKLLVEQPWEIT